MSTPEIEAMRAWGERWGRGMAECSGAQPLADLQVTKEAFGEWANTLMGVVESQAEFIRGLFREETGEEPPVDLIGAWVSGALTGFGRAVRAPEVASV